MLALQQPYSSSTVVITCCHTQIFVGVVTYIGTYHLLSAYYLSTYYYKRMRLLTGFYGTSLALVTAIHSMVGSRSFAQ